MRAYIPFLIVPIACLVLCLAAKGGFSAAAALLNRCVFRKMNLPDSAVRTAIFIFLGADILAAAATAAAAMDDTVKDGYLIREDYGGMSYSEELHVKTAEGEADVEIEVAARRYTAAEAVSMLDEAESAVMELMLDGQEADHVAADLAFPEKLPDVPVSVLFSTSDPSVISWEGELGDDIPAEGAPVTVTADLFFDGEVDIKQDAGEEPATRTVTAALTVYPRNETPAERLARLARRSAESGENASSEKLTLPESVDGRAAEWSRTGSDSGYIFLFLGGVIAIVFLFARQSSDREEEMKKRAAMSRDYPLIIGKLLLLVRAGMSVRGALEKITADYRRGLNEGSGRREGCELVASMVTAMGNGMAESAVYTRLAENAPVREYRTMGLLLSRGIRKGNDETVRLLELSESEAFEERRKAARILGEEAETKMIFPMLLLMGVVFALLMVPAMTAFG